MEISGALNYGIILGRNAGKPIREALDDARHEALIAHQLYKLGKLTV